MLDNKYRYHIYPERIYVVTTPDGEKIEIPGYRFVSFAYSYLREKTVEDILTGNRDTEHLPLEMPRGSHSSSE
jgi:hypothetical protein